MEPRETVVSGTRPAALRPALRAGTHAGTSRRALIAGSATLAGAGILAACGTGAGTTTAPSAGTKKISGGTATFMATGDAERFQIRDNLMPQLLETTGVKGEWIHFNGNGYYDKLLSMMAGDTAPDLFLFAPSYFAEFVSVNRLRNVSVLIKRDKYDLSDFPERSIAQYTWQGNQHGFPQDFPTRSMFYNPQFFQRAGLPKPPGDYGFNPSTWNWNVFLEAAKKFTTGDPANGGTFGWNTQFGWRPYSVWVFANGGEFFNKDLTECLITDAKPMEAIQMLTDLIHRYKVAPTRQQTQAENFNNLFTSGRVGMIEALPGSINMFRAVNGFTFDVAPIPGGMGGGAKVATGGGSGYGMYNGTKNVDAAWEFFKFIEGPEAQLAHARTGATYPSRKSIQVHPEVAVSGKSPEHFKMFVEGQKYVRLDPQVTTWREIEAAIDKELIPLWDNQRPAREAAAAVKRAVDPLLKEATARKPRDA
jgi:multiple sugar transport system substrate-binding protein